MHWDYRLLALSEQGKTGGFFFSVLLCSGVQRARVSGRCHMLQQAGRKHVYVESGDARLLMRYAPPGKHSPGCYYEGLDFGVLQLNYGI